MRTRRALSATLPLAMMAALAAGSTAGCRGFDKNPMPEPTQQALKSSKARMELSPGTVGIRNLDQLALSMSAVTGVPMNAQLASQNAAIVPWLSADGHASSITPSMLLAITGMAGSFCKAFITAEAAAADPARKAHGSVRFGAGPAGLSDGALKGVLSKYARLFWRREASAEELEALAESFDGASKAIGNPANNDGDRSAKLQGALLVPCAAALSSVSFITI